MTFLPYVVLRLYGARKAVPWAQEWSIDILAVAAVFMFPRFVGPILFSSNAIGLIFVHTTIQASFCQLIEQSHDFVSTVPTTSSI